MVWEEGEDAAILSKMVTEGPTEMTLDKALREVRSRSCAYLREKYPGKGNSMIKCHEQESARHDEDREKR